MGLIERIKSALGLGTSASSPSQPGRTRERPTRTEETDSRGDATTVTDTREEPPAESDAPAATTGDAEPAESTDEVDVTVEHEPTIESEETVEPSTETEDAVKGTDTAESDDDEGDEIEADLEDIKGIGPTYAQRLREAGIEDVAALAEADAADLSERADVAESRVQNWIDRAGTY